MEKIRLKDGTEYNIASGASQGFIKVPIENATEFVSIFEKLTEDNLSEYNILAESGEVCAIITDKFVESANLDKTDSGMYALINLGTIDKATKEMKALKETVDLLTLTVLGV